ncbi:hypothetical protein CPB85DRAFT_1561297 [Mucidula mucida]|nr:hypothetical protein CPB85DRAFT_1561297 [Mucidula mucida]
MFSRRSLRLTASTHLSFRSAVDGVLPLWLIRGSGHHPFDWFWRRGRIIRPSFGIALPDERDAHWKALQSRIERTSALPLHLLFHFTTTETWQSLLHRLLAADIHSLVPTGTLRIA